MNTSDRNGIIRLPLRLNSEQETRMTSRNAARRHRGRNRMTSRPDREAPVVIKKLEPATNPHHAIDWWRARIEKPRFVYFIQEGDTGPIKIGEAFDPAARLSNLQCGNPRELVLQAVALATDQTEDRLHRAWMDSRIRGEWFDSDILIQIARKVQGEQIEALGTRTAHDIAFMAEWHIKPSELGWRAA